MWTVVLFKSDNTVDAVPSHCVNTSKNICAWPKKDVKKCLERRLQPNKIEYDFFPARILKTNISKSLILFVDFIFYV